MSPSRWREAIAALGVILSLLLVASEIRQNTEAVRGETIQGIAEMSVEVVLAGFSDPEFVALFERARSDVDSLTAVERARLNWWYNASMRVVENRYRQMNVGLVEDVTEALGGRGGAYQHPYFPIFWEFARNQYPPDFQRWVDDTYLPLVVQP